MLRLLLLLFVGLFATWQIAGEDRGQKRFGLMAADTAPAPVVIAAPVAEPEPQPQPVPVVFTPPTPVMTTPVMTTPVVAAVAEPAPPPADLFYVSGRSVNVRSGPSTGDAVIGTLTRGEAVSVIWVEDNGWARVRVEGDGIDGFMSMDFLTDTPR